MCRASPSYSIELSESVRVPHASRLMEKSSSRRTFAARLTADVALAGGALVFEIGLMVCVGRGRGVSVAAGLRKGMFRQFAPRIAIPTTEKSRHAPARQPTIQPVDIPDLGVACLTGTGLCWV